MASCHVTCFEKCKRLAPKGKREKRSGNEKIGVRGYILGTRCSNTGRIVFRCPCRVWIGVGGVANRSPLQCCADQHRESDHLVEMASSHGVAPLSLTVVDFVANLVPEAQRWNRCLDELGICFRREANP